MFEALRLKFAANKLKRAPRLPKFDPGKDLAKPEEIHLLPPPEQWHWGCPKLNRNEDVQLILSNYDKKQTLWIRLKWRPDLTAPSDANSSKLVTLQTQIILKNGEDQTSYKFEDIQTYEPTRSIKRSGEIIDYGSFGSSFKLTYEQVFRRIRLIFRGDMKGSNGETKYVHFSLIGGPTGRIYDVQTETNPDCFLEQWRAKPEESNMTIDDAIDKLVFENRLEQTFRFTGVLNIGSDDEQEIIYLWGFHSRIFPDLQEKQVEIKRKRLMCHLTNGQVFQAVSASTALDEHKVQIQYGHTCFGIRLVIDPISKPVGKLDWKGLSAESESFEATLSGQTVEMELKAKKLYDLESMTIFDVDFNDTLGFAYFFDECLDESVRSTDIALFSEHLTKHNKLIDEGQVAKTIVLNVADNKDSLVCIIGEDEACLSSDLVGGKASSLAQLSRLAKTSGNEIRVPPAIAITIHGYDLFLAENPSLNEETILLEQFLVENSDNQQAIRDKCQELVTKFEKAKLPEKLRQELKAKLDQLQLDDGLTANEQHPFAVRSSSWGEDTEDMSAAGQLTTKLNVRGLEKLEEAILQCFASKYSAENVLYKVQHGLTPNLPMSVVLQSMVQCHKAGVMFTCDPITGNKSVITISANFGLGESVVSGEADPDQIKVRVSINDKGEESLEVMEAKAGKKSIVISEQPEVHSWDKNNCCMGNDEMLQIARVGRIITRFFQASRDIEWGLRDGVLYLFQSRPITNLDLYSEHELIHECDRVSRAQDEWRTRVNLNEVFPYAITPFTLTYYVQSWTISGAKFNKQFEKRSDMSPEASADILCDAYFNFFSLRRSFVFGFSDPNGPHAHLGKSIEMGFFGHEVGPQPGIMKASKNVPPPDNVFQGFRFDIITTPMRLAPVYTVCRLYPMVRQTEQLVHDDKKWMKAPDPIWELYKILMIALRNHGNSLMKHFLVIFLGGFSQQIFHAILSRHIKDPRELYAALNRFLGAAKNVVSAEIPARLEKLANTIRKRGPEEAEKFAKLPKGEALKYLEDKTIWKDDVAVQFKQFIDGFGHRCYNEWDLRAKPWREDLGAVVEMLQKNCLVPEETAAKISRNKVETNVEIIDALGIKFTAKERFFIRNLFAPRSQAFVAAREFSKDVSIRYIDLERIVSRKLAKELHKKLRLPDTDLFYFLHFDELEPIIKAPQPGIVSQALRRRQLFNRIYKESWKFDEIIPGYHLVPNHLKEKEELDKDILNAPRIIGSPASSGSVRGPVRIIENYQQLSGIQAGDILVTYSTDIGFSPVFPLVAGIITEVGGLISHGAVVAREYGLPSLLGVVNATKILQDGEEIILDANKGYIIRCSKEQESTNIEPAEENNHLIETS